MSPTSFLRAVRRFNDSDTVVIDLHSGTRIVVWNRDTLVAEHDWCRYVEDDGVSHYFDPSSVSQVMGWTSLPDDISLIPTLNGRH
jgi:hypothetical protein